MMMWPVAIMAAMVVSQAWATIYLSPPFQALSVILWKAEAEFCTLKHITPKAVSPEEASNYLELIHLYGQVQGLATWNDVASLATILLEWPGLDQATRARLNEIRNDLCEICYPGKAPCRMSYGPRTPADQFSRENSSEPNTSSRYEPKAAEEISKISKNLNHVVRLEDVVQEPGMDAALGETSDRHAEGGLLTEAEPKTQADHKTSSEAALSSIVAEAINDMAAFQAAVFERSDLDAVETPIHDWVEAHIAAAERESISRHDTLCPPYMGPSCLLNGPDSQILDDPMRWYEAPVMVLMMSLVILYVFTQIALTKLLDFVWTEPFLSALLVILGSCSIVLVKLMWEDREKPEILAAEADEDDEESDEDDEESTADVLREEEATVPFWSRSKCKYGKHIVTETTEQSELVKAKMEVKIITLSDRLLDCQQELKKKDASNYHLQYLLKEIIIEKTGYRKELEAAKASISALRTEKELLCDERQKALDKVKELEEGQDLAKEGWVKLDQIQYLRGIDPDERGEIVDLPGEVAGTDGFVEVM